MPEDALFGLGCEKSQQKEQYGYHHIAQHGLQFQVPSLFIGSNVGEKPVEWN